MSTEPTNSEVHNTLRDLIILGTGRSGTSMLTRMFRHTHYTGDNYLEPDPNNPTGFFEDSRVNDINERILWRFASIGLPTRLGLPGPIPNRRLGLLWLATPNTAFHLGVPPACLERMEELCAKRPFCYKDPRFTYTLPYWEPLLPSGVRKLVMFRSRERTVPSMQRALREMSDVTGVSDEYLARHWRTSYTKLLRMAQRRRDEWLFVSYEDLASGKAIAAIEGFCECETDTQHLDAKISRTSDSPSEPSDDRVFTQLLRAAADDLAKWSPSVAHPAAT